MDGAFVGLCAGELEAAKTESWWTTEACEEEFNFHWSIKQFSKLSERPEITSPILEAGPVGKHHWCIRLDPKTEVDGLLYLGASLILLRFGPDEMTKMVSTRSIPARFKISIVNSKGGLIKAGEIVHHNFTHESHTKSIPKFHRRSENLFEGHKIVEEDGDIFTIKCQIWNPCIKHTLVSPKKEADPQSSMESGQIMGLSGANCVHRPGDQVVRDRGGVPGQCPIV